MKLQPKFPIYLLYTDLSCSPEELIRIYRGWDIIEKSFEQLKNGLEFRRLRTHINKTTEGKVFVGFLVLIMRSFILNKVRTNTDNKNITFEKVLMELKKIKTITMVDMQKILVPLTKMQKTILSILAIPHVDLINSVS